MRPSDQNTRRLRRLLFLLPVVLLLALLLARGLSPISRASAMSAMAPAGEWGLTGFDSPQFHARQFAYVDTNRHIEEMSFTSGGPWYVVDLSARTGASQVFATQDLVGFDSPQFQSKQYTYIDTNHHIEELSITAGQQWIATDLTAQAPGAAAHPAYIGLTGFDSPQFHARQYAYIDTSGHIEDLSITTGGSWAVTDLSAIAISA